MNRAVFVSLSILCLLSVSSITGFIQVVKADGGTITINADGSISPSTAPIHTADNVTYTLTGNISILWGDGIVILRNNIVLNGAGYTLSGSVGMVNGTMLTNISNVTINNMTITNFGFYGLYGISLDSSSNCTLSGNNVSINEYGIMLSNSSNNNLSGNYVTANEYFGIYLQSSSDNNTLAGNNVTANNFGNGIELDSSSSCTLSNNTVTANYYYGIYFDSSSGNTLSGNDVANNRYGIVLSSSSNSNALSGNNLTANSGLGIQLSLSSNNTLSGNNVTNNGNGVELDSASGNTLFGNNLANNYYGIWLDSSSNNFIFHNNFVNNTDQAFSTDSLANVWDNGSVGNYWSDYRTKYPNATQVDGSGVWNTPYVIDSNYTARPRANTDYYPLMVQYVIPEFPSFLILPLFFMATLLAVIVYKRKHASLLNGGQFHTHLLGSRAHPLDRAPSGDVPKSIVTSDC